MKGGYRWAIPALLGICLLFFVGYQRIKRLERCVLTLQRAVLTLQARALETEEPHP